jgi:hypothetical protein
LEPRLFCGFDLWCSASGMTASRVYSGVITPGQITQRAEGAVRLAKARNLWQGLGHENDPQSLQELPLSG